MLIFRAYLPDWYFNIQACQSILVDEYTNLQLMYALHSITKTFQTFSQGYYINSRCSPFKTIIFSCSLVQLIRQNMYLIYFQEKLVSQTKLNFSLKYKIHKMKCHEHFTISVNKKYIYNAKSKKDNQIGFKKSVFNIIIQGKSKVWINPVNF